MDVEMIVVFHDESTERYRLGTQPHSADTWSVRRIGGIDMLIIGHGVPREHVPLSGVRRFMLRPLPRSGEGF